MNLINKTSETPLYSQIAEQIRNDIQNGVIKSGDKLASEHELMEKYHVSRMTVRNAFSELVTEGLIEKHHGKGSFCTGALRKKKIDVLLNMSDHYFIPYYLQSISAVLEHNHAILIARDTKNSNSEIVKQLNEIALRGSDGIILQGCPQQDWDKHEFSIVCKKLEEQNIPLIVIDYAYPLETVCYAAMDEKMIGSLAAEYLHKMGHKQIAAIHIAGDVLSQKRLEGLSQFPLSLITIQYDQYLHRRIQEAVTAGVSAIFCYNDTIAQKCIDFLKEEKYTVPDDISVISVDDTLFAQVYNITSVAHAKSKIGDYAANEILSAVPKSKIFSPELTERGSVKTLL